MSCGEKVWIMNLTDLNSALRDELLIVNAHPKCYQASIHTVERILTTVCSQYLQSPDPQLAYYGNAKYVQMGPHLRKPSRAPTNVTDWIQQTELWRTFWEDEAESERDVDNRVRRIANPDKGSLHSVFITATQMACAHPWPHDRGTQSMK